MSSYLQPLPPLDCAFLLREMDFTTNKHLLPAPKSPDYTGNDTLKISVGEKDHINNFISGLSVTLAPSYREQLTQVFIEVFAEEPKTSKSAIFLGTAVYDLTQQSNSDVWRLKVQVYSPVFSREHIVYVIRPVTKNGAKRVIALNASSGPLIHFERHKLLRKDEPKHLSETYFTLDQPKHPRQTSIGIK